MNSFSHQKIHHAWAVAFACFMVYGATMGLGVNLNGIFNAAISSDLGFSISSFTATTIGGGLISALALMTVVNRVFRKIDIRAVMAPAALFYGLSLALRGFCSELWAFVLVYLLNGLAGSFLLYVPMPLIINSWFRKRSGLALGIVLIASGVTGAVANPVFSAVIEREGWRFATMLTGALSAAIAVPFILFLIRKRPQDIGLRPYGDEPVDPGDMKVLTSPSEVDIAEHANIYYSVSEKKRLFRKSFVLALCVYLVSTVPQQLAHFALTAGLDPAKGAMLVSCGMAGNMLSKALMGLCADRFGKRKAFFLFLLLVSSGLLIFSFSERLPYPVLCICAVLVGFSAANNTMIPSMTVAVYASGEEYLDYVSRVSVATMLSTAFGTFISSAIFDLTGSYSVEFLLYVMINLLSLALVFSIIPGRGKERGKAA